MKERDDLRVSMFLARLSTVVEIYLRSGFSRDWLEKNYMEILDYYETGVNPLQKPVISITSDDFINNVNGSLDE
jgi:hypothetical protein